VHLNNINPPTYTTQDTNCDTDCNQNSPSYEKNLTHIFTTIIIWKHKNNESDLNGDEKQKAVEKEKKIKNQNLKK